MIPRCSGCDGVAELRRDGRARVHRDEDGNRCPGSQQPPVGGIHRPAFHPPPPPAPYRRLRVHCERTAVWSWFRFRSTFTRRIAYAAAPGAWSWDLVTHCARLPAERTENVVTALRRAGVATEVRPYGSAPWGPTTRRKAS